tara:strand:- start:24313 stop:24501 length:189 start_codon:yes stop_codon:yes gene_type:complete
MKMEYDVESTLTKLTLTFEGEEINTFRSILRIVRQLEMPHEEEELKKAIIDAAWDAMVIGQG